jgi:hypothetical protein
MIAVVNPDSSKLTYKLNVKHNENNNIVLHENTPHVDNNEMKDYKYFMFTLID